MRATCVTVRDPFHPLRNRESREVGRRRRIRTLAPNTTAPYIAVLNGRAVMRAEWSRRLRDGDQLAFVCLPRGGGGGSNPLRLVLMIAVMVFAPYAAGLINGAIGLSTTAGSMAMMGMTAAVGMVGSMLINAIIPPPKPPSSSYSGGGYSGVAASPTYSLTAQGNQARIESAIPVQYGRMLCYPDFAAAPYLEYAGNEQYLYQLFCIGAGEFSVEAIRIEDTPASNFDEVSTQVIAPGEYPTIESINCCKSGGQ
jgi:predicted phage tail protein